ncbi:hypothetical protein GCM10010251_29150 [Streptomyces aurantiogriseus]|uniref:Uncharacterized protein n=1 Tax=Streptomyces aurantiogriseus TaxID=66870 RepID=A0A918C7T5_9ACTN|nr:hypothetical protein GCM10010251_29150 [Streptomyces aurantiogriseus]
MIVIGDLARPCPPETTETTETTEEESLGAGEGREKPVDGPGAALLRCDRTPEDSRKEASAMQYTPVPRSLTVTPACRV